MDSYREELTVNGAPPDYTLNGLVDVFTHMAGKLRLEREPPTEDLPKWLEELKDKPILDFDATSVQIVIALGFYLGSTLIENFEHLEWCVGERSMVYFGQPAVNVRTKAKYWSEDPIIMVADNLSVRYLKDGYQRSSVSDPIVLHIKSAERSLAEWKALKQQP